MNDTLVVYESKYGGTVTYIDLLARSLPFDVMRLRELKRQRSLPHRTVVLASGVYTGRIAAAAALAKHADLLAGKRVLVLAVGASEPGEEVERQLREANLAPDHLDVPLFYARGAYDEGSFKLPDRIACRALRAVVRDKDPSELDPGMRALASVTGSRADWTDPRYLDPLIRALRG